MIRPLRHRVALLLALALAVAVDGTARAQQGTGPWSVASSLLAEGGPDHVFLALPGTGGWSLHHHEPAAGPMIALLRPLVRPPLAIAARGATMWLVSSSAEPGPRSVFRLELRRGPDGRWIALPPDRLEKLPALPGEGVLAGFVATRDGPVAVVTPDAMDRDGEPVRVLRLQQSAWTELAAPPLAPGERVVALGAWGPDSEQLLALVVPAGQRSARARADAWWYDGTGPWTRTELPLDARTVRAIEPGLGGWPVIVRGRGGRADEDAADLASEVAAERRPGDPASTAGDRGDEPIRLDYIVPPTAGAGPESMLRAFAEVELPSPWSLVGGPGRLRVYAGRQGADLQVRTLDTALGTWGDAEALGTLRPDPAELWRGPMLVAVAAFALVMAVLLKPGTPRPCVMPKGFGVAAPSARLLAFMIDFIPGAIVAVLALGVHPAEVLRLPLTTLSLADGLPYAVAGLVAVGIGLLGEWTRGTTPGKALLGMRVVSVDGEPLRFGQALIRSLVRVPVVLAPMLAAFALVNPNGQGLPDLVARTLVVARKPRPAKPS